MAAESFARANNHITIRDTDPDNKWKNGDDQGIENWSRAYARLSSGTAFVFYQDTTQIPEALDKYWNAERSESTYFFSDFGILSLASEKRWRTC